MDFYKLTPADLLVICDDVNLPLGQLRMRPGGSAGGHNGLKDIQQQLGTQEYARLRLGVSGPDREDLVDHVLARFKPSEREVVQDMLIRAAQAAGCWMREGVAVTMNRFNAPEKEPKPKKPKAAEDGTKNQRRRNQNNRRTNRNPEHSAADLLETLIGPIPTALFT